MPRTAFVIAGVATAMLASGTAAFGQKSKNTLRVAINDPFSVLDSYHVPHEEVGYFVRTIYGTLVTVDEHKGKFVPNLAKAWRRIDNKTIEFDLRNDVMFHSGNKFTAEDIKHTIEYLGDPKVRIRFKARYDWVDKVEVLGPYKLRIVAKKPSATDLSTIAYRFRSYDSKVHKSLDNPAAYGRVSASSTGPYRMVSINDKDGLVIERWTKFYGSPYYRAPIKRVVGAFMPDRQTQKAELITGGIDVMRDITADDARLLAENPQLAITPTSSKQILYLTLDAAGRSDSKVMTDERVRKAMIMAIDRTKLVHTFVAGGKAAELPMSVCFKTTAACKPTTHPYPYNPAEAKKLLTEAGYPNGFDLNLNVYATIKDIGVAVAGFLREVGIRASVEPLPLQVYVKRRGEGKFTAFLGKYPTSAQPDTDNLLNFFFGANRDYYKDSTIHAAAKEGSTEFDDAKRAAIYAPALDRVNEKAYIYPVSEVPIVYAHTADVRIEPNLRSAGEIRPEDFFWTSETSQMK